MNFSPAQIELQVSTLMISGPAPCTGTVLRTAPWITCKFPSLGLPEKFILPANLENAPHRHPFSMTKFDLASKASQKNALWITDIFSQLLLFVEAVHTLRRKRTPVGSPVRKRTIPIDWTTAILIFGVSLPMANHKVSNSNARRGRNSMRRILCAKMQIRRYVHSATGLILFELFAMLWV